MSSVLMASADARLDMSEKRRKVEVVWDKHDGIVGRIIYLNENDGSKNYIWDSEGTPRRSEGTPRRFGPDNAANVAKAMRWLAREVVKAYKARDASWRAGRPQVSDKPV